MHITGIYATTAGNTELVMEYIADQLKALGGELSLQRAEKTPITDIQTHDVFILGTSTWEHGELNPFFNRLFKELKNADLKGKKAAFVGCGDIRYEPILFCAGSELLRTTWLQQGGQQLAQPLKINNEPHHQLETMVKPWVANLWHELQELKPA